MGVLRRWVCVYAALGLAGCAGFGGSDPAVTRLAMVGGAVTAAVPVGYCIETQASRPSDGFAVMARCDVIATADIQPFPGGFVTLQVGRPGSAQGISVSDLPDLLQGAAGRALLSQTGTASEITVQEAGSNADSATVRFLDRGAAPVAGLQQTEWRGFLDLSGRLTTVSVRGLDAAPLGTDEGLILLERVMQALRLANPEGTAAAG